jgi:hypothetical protein
VEAEGNCDVCGSSPGSVVVVVAAVVVVVVLLVVVVVGAVVVDVVARPWSVVDVPTAPVEGPPPERVARPTPATASSATKVTAPMAANNRRRR